MSKQHFVEEYFHRQPVALPNSASSFCEWVSWELVSGVLSDSTADVMVVKDGEQSLRPDPLNAEVARSLVSDGHTIGVRHAERHDARFRELATQFQQDFRAPVDVHIYVTPPGQHGFSWHYDAEDVFIVQATGQKEYSLRKNSVHPWPIVETIPVDMQYAREIMPLMRVLLAPGDWLYIPNGYWHKAETPRDSEAAISLAVGVLSPSAIDLFDYLRGHLLQSLLWRSRLPVVGRAGQSDETISLQQYRDVTQLLADDLMRIFKNDRFLASFIQREGGETHQS